MAAHEPRMIGGARWWLTLGLLSGCADDGRECGEDWGLTKDGTCRPLSTYEDEGSDSGEGPGPGTNSPPTAPGISLQPDSPRAEGADLVCHIDVPAVDIDGDTVTYVVRWSVDGSGFSGAVDGAEAGDTVPGAALEESQRWTCTVHADDGLEAGPAITETVKVGPPYLGWDEQIISLSQADHVLLGEEDGDGAGGYVASAGDVDGDGLADMLVAAYWNDEAGRDAGKSYLFLGKDLGAERTIYLADAAWSFVGEHGTIEDDPDCEDSDPMDDHCGGDWAGHTLSSAGDVDGDGLSDIVISGYRSDEVDFDAGKTYLVFSSSLSGRGSMGLADADVSFLGENVSDRMGHSIHSAGDVDGDGLSDVITGAYGHDGTAEDAGRAYLVLADRLEPGTTVRFPDEADFIWDGEAEGDESGYINAPAGDVDGDGLGDFMTSSLRNQDGGVGLAPGGENGAGKVYVVLGADLNRAERGAVYNLGDVDRAWMGEEGGDAVGYGINTVGDFDGDGLDDVMAGSYGNSEAGDAAGKVHVMTAASMATPGTHSLSVAEYGFVGEQAGAWAGFGAGPAGDFDSDGLADLLIGGAWHSDDATFTGRAYLVLAGSLGGPGTYDLSEADHIFLGEEGWDTAGYKLTGLGDVNGDGMGDLFIAAWQGDRPEEPGKAYVVLNPD